MKIRPNVYLIHGRASNFYLCIDPDSLTLIDAGMPNEQHLLFNLLDELGYKPQRLQRILITHADIDHAGSLAAIQSKTEAAVYASAEAHQYLTTGKSPDHMPRIIQWIANTFVKYKPVSASCIEIIRDGDELPVLGGLTALATPGHTMDHFSFYTPKEGILFAGDALNTRDKTLKRSSQRITADEKAADQSAIRLLQLTPATIACGHGNPLSDPDLGDFGQFFNSLRTGE